MKKNIKISIAIVTRNRSKLLQQALLFLTTQTTKPGEILVVDNNSSDNTRQIVKSFKKKLPIRYIFEPKVGIPYARNRALQEATGEILAFIDDDCEAFPNWLEEIGKNHQRYPAAAAIQGSGVVLNQDSLIPAISESLNQQWLESNLTTQGKIGILITMNMSIKIKVIRKFKLRFDENFAKYFRGEDTDFAYQLISKKLTIRYCHSIKVFYQARRSLAGFLKQRFNSGSLRAYLRHKWRYYPFIYQPRKLTRNDVFEKIKWFLKPFYPYLLQISDFVLAQGLLKESYLLSYKNNQAFLKPTKTKKKLYLTVVLGEIHNDQTLQNILESLIRQKIKPQEIVIYGKNIFKIPDKLPFQITWCQDELIEYLNSIKSPNNIAAFLNDQCNLPKDWSQKILQAHTNLPETSFIQGRVVCRRGDKLGNLYSQFEFDEKFFLRSNKIIDFISSLPANLSIKTPAIKNIKSTVDFIKSQSSEFKTEEIITSLAQERFLISFVPGLEIVEKKDQSLQGLFKESLARGRFQKSVDYFKNTFLDKSIEKPVFPVGFFMPNFSWLFHPSLQGNILILPILFFGRVILRAGFVLGYQTKLLKTKDSLFNDYRKTTNLKAGFITIAVITRNRSSSLSRLLESFTRQSLIPAEILIIDNGSTDRTKNLVRSYKKLLPVRYIYEPKIGIPLARNRAIKEASTEMLAFIDDDCIVPINWLKTLSDAYYEHPEAAAIQGSSVSLPHSGAISFIAEHLRHSWFARNLKGGIKSYLKSFAAKSKNLAISTIDSRNVLLNLKILKSQQIKFDESYERGSDTDLGKQIAAKKQTIIFYPKLTVYHYERDNWVKFLIQAFNKGKAWEVINNHWPSEYQGDKSNIFKQLAVFVKYCLANNKTLSVQILLPLFLAHVQSFNLGRLFMKVKLYFSSDLYLRSFSWLRRQN